MKVMWKNENDVAPDETWHLEHAHLEHVHPIPETCAPGTYVSNLPLIECDDVTNSKLDDILPVKGLTD